MLLVFFCFLQILLSSPKAIQTETLALHPVKMTANHQARKELLYKLKRRNQYLSESAFIGNSIGVGQQMYFDSKGAGFLGEPTMLVKGCYSFMNDTSSSSEYKISYNGIPCRAKDAIALCGAKRVFINMGTNDMWLGNEGVQKAYAKYLAEIRQKNPDVVIFVESMTHVQAGKENSHLNNANIDQLNSFLEDFCQKHKDLYFIDVSSVLRDPDGSLRPDCCSDGYVHISMKGYELWTGEICKYVDGLLDMEEAAENAVNAYSQSGSEEDYQTASEAVDALEKSTVKQNLTQELRQCRSLYS